jgi:hypothetical protein
MQYKILVMVVELAAFYNGGVKLKLPGYILKVIDKFIASLQS